MSCWGQKGFFRGLVALPALQTAFPAVFLLPALLAFLLPGCARGPGLPAEFQRELGDSVLYAANRDGVRGILDFAKAGPPVMEIRVEPPLVLPPGMSLTLEYGLNGSPVKGTDLILRCPVRSDGRSLSPDPAGPAFILPWDEASCGFPPALNPPPLPSIDETFETPANEASAGGIPANETPAGGTPSDETPSGGTISPSLRYTTPLMGHTLAGISITVAAREGDQESLEALRKSSLVLELRSLNIVPRWYGIDRSGGSLNLSPFVFASPQGGAGLDLPEEFAFPQGDLVIRAGGIVRPVIESLRLEATPLEGEFIVPSGLLPSPIRRFVVEGEDLESVRLIPSRPRPFPEPIPLDPALILDYPQASWRQGAYEIFRWESFPSLLIFDTADYAVQDRLLKRLAFFVEKAGYRGRLAGDEEIAGQHGWNAHDYRAQDLARFFEAARLQDFPLLPEERELESILLDARIIRREGGGILAGEGGIISISRESEGYLRSLFMAHEGFHGIFFVDEDFQEFSRRRWEGLNPGARRFILSYFDYQHYDIKDEYLVINEFMAHVLQQPVSRAGRYFGETLASRLDASPWRRTVLPEKDESTGTWPVLAEAFLAEARAFDAYVAGRWGLGAGRVYRIRVRRDPA